MWDGNVIRLVRALLPVVDRPLREDRPSVEVIYEPRAKRIGRRPLDEAELVEARDALAAVLGGAVVHARAQPLRRYEALYATSNPAAKLKGRDFVGRQVEAIGIVPARVHDLANLGRLPRHDFGECDDRHGSSSLRQRRPIGCEIRVIQIGRVLRQPGCPELAKGIGDGDGESQFGLCARVLEYVIEELRFIASRSDIVGRREVCNSANGLQSAKIVRCAVDIARVSWAAANIRLGGAARTSSSL